MDIQSFLSSIYGRYIIQTFFHSLAAVALVSILLRLWKIENPLIVQRFRFLVILLPVFSFPVYHLVNPVRSEVSFRLYALFDSSRWLDMALWECIPAGLLLAPLFLLTSLVLIFQEIIPVIKQLMRSGSDANPVDNGAAGKVNGILRELRAPRVDNYVIQDSDPVLIAKSGRSPAILVSSGLLKMLNYEQLKAALAHEVAHTIRNRRPFLIFVFLVRLMTFFNPVTLIAFRNAVSDEEKICDDMAVSLTGKAQALADTLRMFCPAEATGKSYAFAPGFKSLAGYGHIMSLRSRVERLEKAASGRVSLPRLKFALTFLAIGVINYFIV